MWEHRSALYIIVFGHANSNNKWLNRNNRRAKELNSLARCTWSMHVICEQSERWISNQNRDRWYPSHRGDEVVFNGQMARESLEIAFIFQIVHSMHKYINKIYLNIKFQVMLEANQISFVLNCVADQSNKWTFWGTLNGEWKIYHFKQKPQPDNGMFGKSIRPKSLLYVDDNQTLQRKESIESIVEFLNSH